MKRMLIDARHSEETRVVVVSGTRLEELDVETSTKKQIKGNIYLAKVIRVEPSLQAAFVEYGGNRHGFLAFSEIHPDYFQIPVADRQAILAEQRAEDMRNGDGDHDSGGESEGDGEPAPSPPPATEELAVQSSDILHGEITSPGDGAEPSAEAPAPSEADSAENGGDPPLEPVSGVIETVVGEPVSVEMLGGDDPSEVERPRPRSLRNYKIQEVIKRRQIMLVQVVKEERGNKGAALTTFLSLAGRYCVLMPNTARGGGVSRKITNSTDRRRLKSITSELDIPDGMAVIVRTAGQERTKPEIKRDFEYLIRVWDNVRELTLRSTAPALVYEEGSLIKRAIRDLYARDIEEVHVEGEDAYRMAKDYMRMLTPSHAKKVQPYRDPVPLFHRYQVESQLDAMHNPIVQLRSGGYIVINQTEALVAIDVNSGRATRERHIEDTAFKTNCEAADEVARQLRLRDLAGLIVIDFIDMEDSRNNATVERRLKEAMKSDRARIQLGRISHFGLLELSRQRLRPSLQETAFQACTHCAGTGMVRSVESTAVYILRAIEEEGIRRRSSEVSVWVPGQIALYILNQKREQLNEIESRYGFRVFIYGDETLIPPNYRMDRVKSEGRPEEFVQPVRQLPKFEEEDEAEDETEEDGESETEEAAQPRPDGAAAEEPRRKRRRRKRRRRDERPEIGADGLAVNAEEGAAESEDEEEEESEESGEGKAEAAAEGADGTQVEAEADGEDRPRRRRGKRGGRRRGKRPEEEGMSLEDGLAADGAALEAVEDGTALPAAASETETPSEAAIEPEAKKPARRSRRAEAPEGEVRPKRTRRPRAAVEAAADVAQPTAEEVASPESPAPGPQPAAARPEPAAEPQSVPEPAPEPVLVVENPAVQALQAPPEPPQPARKGWWNRILP